MIKKFLFHLFFIALASSNAIPFIDARCHIRCRPRRIQGWHFTNRVRPFVGLNNYYPRYYDYPYYRTYPYIAFGFGIGMPRYGYPIGFW